MTVRALWFWSETVQPAVLYEMEWRRGVSVRFYRTRSQWERR